MTHIEAMKQALEALEVDAYVYNGEKSWKAITSLRQVIAEAEKQEPVFWYRPVGEDGGYEGPIHNCSIEKVRKECGAWKPLYTHPQPKAEQEDHDDLTIAYMSGYQDGKKAQPKRKPLTDEQISDLWCKVSNTDFVTADTHVFARAIEAAHGIKGE